MKKVFLGLILSFLSICAISAQDQTGKFSIAGNLNYGTKIESLGVGLRAQYGFMEKLRGSLEYKYYIDRHSLSAWGISADAHYIFPVSEKISLYPIAGITLSRWTYDASRILINDIDFGGFPKSSENRLGFNIGFAGQIGLSDNTFLQVEAKEALIKDFIQFVISVGFMYQF